MSRQVITLFLFKLKKKITRIAPWLFILFLLIFLLFNASPGITEKDEQYLVAFLKEWNIELDKKQIHRNQENEVAFISRLQDSVLHSISHFTISFDSAGKVENYFHQRKGLCFDRSLLLEKFCLLAGFKVRHLYIFFNGDGQKPERSDFFKKGLTSHAMFEVKTSQGWMAVGTNSNWLGQDIEGSPLSLKEIRSRLGKNKLELKKSFTVGLPFYDELRQKDAFRFVYGIYSRHGQFLKSRPLETWLNSIGLKSKLPDYNINMLFSNL